jgi:hypothetical protein
VLCFASQNNFLSFHLSPHLPFISPLHSSVSPLDPSILGQCQVPFPAPAVRKGSSHFKSSPQTAPVGMGMNMTTNKGVGSTSSSGMGIGMGMGSNGSSSSSNHSSNSAACANNSSGSSSTTHRNHSSTHTKNKFFAANSTAATAPEVVFKGPPSNTNSSQFSSFRDGHNFTAHELWLRMKTKGKQLRLLFPCF